MTVTLKLILVTKYTLGSFEMSVHTYKKTPLPAMEERIFL